MAEVSVWYYMDIAISTGIDLLLIAVFVIAILLAARKGLVRGIIGLIGNVVAVVVAFMFSGSLGSYINSNFLYQPMRQWVINMLSPTSGGTTASISDLNFDELFSDMPQFFSEILKHLGLNSSQLAESYSSMKVNGVEEAKSAVIDMMVSPMADICGRVIAFVVIFILALIAINIIVWLLDFVVELPILRQINKIGGIVLGAINGILFVFILAGVINISIGYIMNDRTAEEIDKIEESTVIYKTVNSINPVRMIFDSWQS
ncbi:MAG: CvpA family protein [Clostridiales bacterium]|nr:CvpA family protein [Clostridiales bacterium]